MVELVDTRDLKSRGPCARAGPTPALGTNRIKGFQLLRLKPLYFYGTSGNAVKAQMILFHSGNPGLRNMPKGHRCGLLAMQERFKKSAWPTLSYHGFMTQMEP